jgi:hypothetical protein
LPDLNQLHHRAREIFDHALSSVDPRQAVKQVIKVDGSLVDIGGVCLDGSSRRIYAIPIGKGGDAAAEISRLRSDAAIRLERRKDKYFVVLRQVQTFAI